MCKVYSKEIEQFLDMTMNKNIYQKEKRNSIVKNRNYNTCSGTAFIKP